ncbi:MAG TPA: flagellar basal body rod protein FlgC [Candidatus Aquilonibacter sp.]|nr:flagellar basal body rod protein FlgC [Candidatus Aquilonibacter sp.]
MNLFGVLDISGSALTAERERAEIVTSNLANAETTNTPEGGPYKRMQVVFASTHPRPTGFSDALASVADLQVQGVQVQSVVADSTAPIQRYDPGNPEADAKGFVSYPNVNPSEEMVDLMGAARSYDLNASAIQATKAMIQSSIQILE